MNFSKEKSILIVVGLALVVLFSVVLLIPKARNSVTNLLPVDQQKQQNEKLIKEYENNVKTVLKPYFAKQNFDNVLDKLLELTVPSSYQLLHLSLVIEFDNIRIGQSTFDQSKIEEGITKIDQLASQYTWLK